MRGVSTETEWKVESSGRPLQPYLRPIIVIIGGPSVTITMQCYSVSDIEHLIIKDKFFASNSGLSLYRDMDDDDDDIKV